LRWRTEFYKGQQAVLTAPPSACVGTTRYQFVRWFIGNLPQAKGQASTQLVMDQDHTVLA